MPRRTRSSTLFPYTTLFRSPDVRVGVVFDGRAPVAFPRAGPVEDHGVGVEELLRHVFLDRNRLTIAHPHPHDTMVFNRSEEHTSELQSRQYLVCRLLLEKKK